MKLTIKEIAKLSGVSQATVSRVLNNSASVKEETKRRIEKIIEEYHYTPNAVARSLSKNETNNIGVIIPDISNPFFCEVIKGVSSVANENGLNIILCDTHENQQKEIHFLNSLKNEKLKGIIITPVSDTYQFDSDYSNLLEGMNVPIILVDRDVKYSNFDGVFIDNIKGAFEATSALIQEGHRNIAVIAGPTTSKPGRDRLIGYKKEYMMNNIPINEELIFYGDFGLESGYNNAKKILNSKHKPTAIFSCNNLMTIGVLKALTELHLQIPDDIALIGFDDIEILDTLGFKISSISRPTFEMGEIAMEMLINQLKNRNKAKDNTVNRVTLIPQLILRGSEKLIRKE